MSGVPFETVMAPSQGVGQPALPPPVRWMFRKGAVAALPILSQAHFRLWQSLLSTRWVQSAHVPQRDTECVLEAGGLLPASGMGPAFSLLPSKRLQDWFMGQFL